MPVALSSSESEMCSVEPTQGSSVNCSEQIREACTKRCLLISLTVAELSRSTSDSPVQLIQYLLDRAISVSVVTCTRRAVNETQLTGRSCLGR